MPWAEVTVFHGSTEDALRLLDAIGRNCECQKFRRRCPAHSLLAEQLFIDHVLFLRWLHLKEESRARSVPDRKRDLVHN